MSFIAGDILIRMAADVASLRTDMDNAKSTVGNAVTVMKNAAIALGGAFSAQMFVGWMKGAIDAADEISKLSTKTGIAVSDLSGLQLAFQLGGAETGAFATSMSKLAKQVVEGNGALKSLGIETRNADGTVRGIKDILYETADAFKETEDGTAKTALAIEIFGKSGADLIPILNTGSDGLREMDEMARKLGLTFDEETGKKAEEFNDTMDLIGLSSQGVARQVAAELLPTLTSLAGNLFENITQGNTLTNVAGFLATSLKLLFTAGAIGAEIFKTLGLIVGAVIANVVAVLNGDFKAASTIVYDSATDIKDNWVNTAETVKKVWEGAGGDTVSAMVKVQGSLKKLTPATNDQKEASKKADEEARKLLESYQKLSTDISNKTGLLIAESTQTDKLTEGQKVALKVMQDIQTGTIKLTDEQKIHIGKLLEEMLQQEKNNTETEKATKAKKDYEDGLIKVAAAQGKEIEELRKGNEKLEEQNFKLRNGEAALLAREQRLLLNRAEELRWQAALDDGNTALGAQADALERRAALLGENAVLQEAKDTATEWQKTAKTIEEDLTGALMRGFESGKGFLENLRDTAVNMFKTLILRPVISAVMNPIAQGITGMLGMAGSASAATGGAGGAGSMLSGLPGAAGLLGGASAFGTGIMSGLSAWGAGGSVTGLLGTGSALFSGGLASGLGTIAGALGPIALGLGAIYLIAQKAKGETRSGSSFGYSEAGGNVSMLGQDLAFSAGVVRGAGGPSGGAIGGASGNAAITQSVTGTINSVNALLTGLGSSAQIDNFWAKVETSDRGRGGVLSGGLLSTGARFGESGLGSNYDGTLFEAGTPTSLNGEEALKAFGLDLQQVTIQALQSATDIPRTIKDMLEGIDAEALGEEAVGGLLSAINETVTGVSALRTAVRSLPMQNLANISFDAAAALIDLAGGLDTLLGQINEYISLYYSTEEKAGLEAQSVVSALQAVGIDTTNLATKDDFRLLVESRDVSTVSGQAQLATLLSVAGNFASVADYLAENDIGSLQELINNSPQTALLTDLLTPQEITATSTLEMSVGISTSNTWLTKISASLDGISTTAAAAVASARAATVAANAAAASASAAVVAIGGVVDNAALDSAAPSYSTDLGTSS